VEKGRSLKSVWDQALESRSVAQRRNGLREGKEKLNGEGPSIVAKWKREGWRLRRRARQRNRVSLGGLGRDRKRKKERMVGNDERKRVRKDQTEDQKI